MSQAESVLGNLFTPIVVSDLLRVLNANPQTRGIWLVPHPQDDMRALLHKDLVRAHIMIAILLRRLEEPTTDIPVAEAMQVPPGTRILTEEYEGGLRITVLSPKEDLS